MRTIAYVQRFGKRTRFFTTEEFTDTSFVPEENKELTFVGEAEIHHCLCLKVKQTKKGTYSADVKILSTEPR